MDLVAVSDLTKWRETLALLSTYGKNEVQYSTVHLNVMQSYLEEWSPAQSIIKQNLNPFVIGLQLFFFHTVVIILSEND